MCGAHPRCNNKRDLLTFRLVHYFVRLTPDYNIRFTFVLTANFIDALVSFCLINFNLKHIVIDSCFRCVGEVVVVRATFCQGQALSLYWHKYWVTRVADSAANPTRPSRWLCLGTIIELLTPSQPLRNHCFVLYIINKY